MKKIYLLVFSIFSTFAFSQLEADLYEINYLDGIVATDLFRYENKILFAGSKSLEIGPSNGRELWAYDLDTNKSTLIKDIVEGYASPFGYGSPRFVQFNNKVYFLANISSKTELWSTDGTTDGTQKVFEFPQENSYIKDIVVNNQKIIITSENRVFSSDGTAAGTALLMEMTESVSDKTFSTDNYFVFGSSNALWMINGRTQPFQIIDEESNEQLYMFNELYFYNVNGKLLFYSRNQNGSKDGIWAFDPVNKKAKFLFNSRGVFHGQILNDKLIYNGWDANLGGRLFVTNATDESTMPLTFTKGAVSSMSNQDFLIKLGNNVYFFPFINNERNRLWKTDGTLSGTVATSIVIPDYASPEIIKMFPQNERVLIENASHNNWWLMDKFENVVDLGSKQIQESIELSNKIVFNDTTSKFGRELYQFDFATNSISLFHDSTHQKGSFPINGKNTEESSIIFTATDGEFGNQFYSVKNDESPKLIKSLLAPYGVPSGELFQVGNYLYVKPSSYNHILAKTNGDAINTKTLSMPINNLIDDKSIFGNLNNESLLFTTYSNSVDLLIKLWKNEKDSDEIQLIKEIPTGPNNQNSSGISYNDEFYFTIETADYKKQIWKTNGTAEGTKIAFTIPGYPETNENLRLLQVFDNQLLISRTGQLWKYNGLTGTTTLIPFPQNDPFPNLGWNISTKPAVIDDKLYLVSQNGYGSIFKFENLQTPPVEILNDNDFHPFTEFKKCGNQIFAGTGANDKNYTMWSINMNDFSNHKIVSNSFNSPISDFSCINNYLYFRRENDFRVYRTNGISIDTQNINILNNEQLTNNDSILKLYTLNNKLYFAAKTTNSGEELYYVRTELPVFLSTNDSQGSSLKNKIILYPNPASDFIKIKNDESLETGIFKVFDMSGKLIQIGNFKSENQDINISGLLKGNYILEMTTKNGQKFSQKFIKK